MSLWDDNFTGTNGDPPDTDKWIDDSSGGGSIEIQSNKLRCATTGNGIGRATCKAVVSGDFDVRVDIDSVLAPNIAGWLAWIRFYIDSTHYSYVCLWKQNDDAKWSMAYALGGAEQYPDQDIRSSESGALRITRSGSTVRVFYDEDRTGSWTELDSSGRAIGSGDGEIDLCVLNWTNNPSCSGDFDNFEFFEESWTGKICGVTNPSKICGVAVADIVKVCGVE